MLSQTLDLAMQTPQLHALWLNTLAFLEHVGCRKIVKSQDSTYLTEMVLEHAAEEARHAHFFKKSASRISNTCPTFEPQFILAGEAPENYFQSLDREVEEHLKNYVTKNTRTFLCYLYVTLMIEERALEVYELYDEKLKKAGIPLSLGPVLFEEHRHLDQMRNLLEANNENHEHHYSTFKKVEERLYSALIGEIHKDLSLRAFATAPLESEAHV